MGEKEDKIESMRKEHENPTEWRVRKAFLVRNYDNLDPGRLECLSNCFANHELYGAGYPDKVMAEVGFSFSWFTFSKVRELSEGLIDSLYNGGR